MVVVTKKDKESEDRLIARFKKDTLDIIQEARERQRYKSKAEKRKEKKKRLDFLKMLERKRNRQ